MESWTWLLVAVLFIIVPVLLIRPGLFNGAVTAVGQMLAPGIGPLVAARDIPGLLRRLDVYAGKRYYQKCAQIMDALGSLGAEAAPGLVAFMHEHWMVWREIPGADAALIRTGIGAVEPLLAEIEHSDIARDVLVASARATPEVLCSLREQDTLARLEQMWARSKPWDRKYQLTPVFRVIDSPQLNRLLSHEAARVRDQDRAAAVRAAVDDLRTGAYETKLAAIRALAALGDPEAIPPLEAFTRDLGPGQVELLFDRGQRSRAEMTYPNGHIPSADREMLWRGGLAGRCEEITTLASVAISHIQEQRGEKQEE